MNPRTIPNEFEMTVIKSAPDQEVHLLDLLIVLSKRRKFIILFTLAITLLTAIVVLVIPSKYTAETIVLPPKESSSAASSMLGQLGSASALASMAGGGLGIKNPGDMYVALFKVPGVENALIQRFGLMARYHAKRMSDARKSFENRSSVVFGTKDGLIRVTVTDRDPKMAADIANAYVDQFRNLSEHLAITEAAQRRVFFEQQLKETNDQLAIAEEAMKSMEQKTGVLQIDSQARALIEAAGTLRGQIAAKEVQLQAMRSYATEDNSQLVVVEQELAGLKTQLAKLGGTDTVSTNDVIVPKGNIPAAQMEYIRRYRDLKYYETIEEIIARQFEMAKLDEAKEGAIIQVADLATPPDKRSSPMRVISTLIAFILGFFVACGWCVFQSGLERLKNDPAERERLEALRAALR